MSKDISHKNRSEISKTKEEFEKFLKAKSKKPQKPEIQSASDPTTEQGMVKTTATLHCHTVPGKISIMEFEVTDECALLVRTVPVKNERTNNINKQDNNSYSFTKKIVTTESDSGCPHCQNPLKFFCDCGVISCHPEKNIYRHTCPVCKNSGLTTSFTKPKPITGSRSANDAAGKCGSGDLKHLPRGDKGLVTGK